MPLSSHSVKRGFNNRSKLLDGQWETQALPSSVHLLPNKPQVKAMHTVIRYVVTLSEI